MKPGNELGIGKGGGSRVSGWHTEKQMGKKWGRKEECGEGTGREEGAEEEKGAR